MRIEQRIVEFDAIFLRNSRANEETRHGECWVNAIKSFRISVVRVMEVGEIAAVNVMSAVGIKLWKLFCVFEALVVKEKKKTPRKQHNIKIRMN